MELNSWGPQSCLERERKIRHRLFISSIRCEIKDCHIIVMQWRQRNVRNSVMHLLSCCFMSHFCHSCCRCCCRCYKLKPLSDFLIIGLWILTLVFHWKHCNPSFLFMGESSMLHVHCIQTRFVIGWKNNKNGDISMPLSLKTIGNAGYRDQWNNTFGWVQVNRLDMIHDLINKVYYMSRVLVSGHGFRNKLSLSPLNFW